MLTIRLDSSMESQLDDFARETGLGKSYYVKKR